MSTKAVPRASVRTPSSRRRTASAKTPKPKTGSVASAAEPKAVVVRGIRISHPDRILYPDLQLSKAELTR